MKTIIIPALMANVALFRPFDPNNKPGWKLNEAGDAVLLKDGNPIYVQADGTEAVIASDTISQRNAEAKANRERAENAEKSLKAFEGLDAAKAREALELVGKLDQKKLIDAGEVDKLKESMRGEFQTIIDTANKERDEAVSARDNLVMDAAFSGSKFITDRLLLPPDITRATFGKNFKLENGKIVAYGSDGNKILSKQKIGEDASFDEAMEHIVSNYPQRDMIMKGGNHGGGGNQGGGGGGTPGKARYSRKDYDTLPPREQARIGSEVGQGKAEIYD